MSERMHTVSITKQNNKKHIILYVRAKVRKKNSLNSLQNKKSMLGLGV